MLKPASLRADLTGQCPWLAANPDKLLVFIDSGRIRNTGGASLSFEYRYTLNLVATDYQGHPSALIVPILAWLRTNQPEAALNPDLNEQAFTFEADILNHSTMDLSIKLVLSERVVVTEDTTGALTIEHMPEPPLDDDTIWEEVFVKPDTAPDWTVPDPMPA